MPGPIPTSRPHHLPLVAKHVACAGEIVAVVAARTAAEARDAAELVDVDYEELPAVFDAKEALKDEVLAHPDKGTNKSAFWQLDSKAQGSGGDVEEAIATARESGILIEREYRQQRLIPAFMEPRSTVVDPTGEQVTMWSATQIPHILKFLIAATTGMPEHKVRVIAPDVGGGFGGKLQTTPEEFITRAVARRLGKPAKYTETRSESLISAHHGRDQYQKLTLAATKDGTVTGLKVELIANLGAYVAVVGGGVPVLGAWMFNSIYKLADQFNADRADEPAVVDAYRGAGRPEATFAIERIMDELAVEVGVDPLQIREQNWIKHEEFPFTTVAGMTYDSGNYEAATARAKELFDYDALRAEQQQRRESGDPVQLGIGVSTFTEMCGLAPSRILGSLSYGAGGWEHASIRMLPTGKVEVITGISPHGQGHETGFSQIVADRLGVPFEDVEILHGDTQVAHKGLDTYGSRSLVVGGEAVVRAADKVIEKARAFAAHLLEADPDDLEFEAGRFSVKGTDKGIGITEVALATFASHNYPEDLEPGIDADATYDPVNFSFPHGTHLCAVEVDTETGAVTMRKYACVDDVGVIINPLLVEGQVHGGLVQDQPSAVGGGVRRPAPCVGRRRLHLPTRTIVVTRPTVSQATTRRLRVSAGRREHPGGRQRHRRRGPPRHQRHRMPCTRSVWTAIRGRSDSGRTEVTAQGTSPPVPNQDQ